MEPGPASSVEEHSLRKIRSQGDCGSNLAEDFSFQACKLIRTKMFDGNFRLSDVLHRTHATLPIKAVATISTGQKRKHSLEQIGPMMSLLRRWTMTSYTLLRNSTLH